jgi:hypothetical protein
MLNTDNVRARSLTVAFPPVVSHRSLKWDSLVGHFIVVFNKVNQSCPAVPLVPRENELFPCEKTKCCKQGPYAAECVSQPMKVLGTVGLVFVRAGVLASEIELSKISIKTGANDRRATDSSVVLNVSFVVLPVKGFLREKSGGEPAFLTAFDPRFESRLWAACRRSTKNPPADAGRYLHGGSISSGS